MTTVKPPFIEADDAALDGERETLRFVIAARLFLEPRFRDLREADWEKGKPISHGYCREAAKFLAWVLSRDGTTDWAAVEGRCRYAGRRGNPMDAHCYVVQRNEGCGEALAFADVTADQFGWSQICVQFPTMRQERWEDEADRIEDYRLDREGAIVLRRWKTEWPKVEAALLAEADRLVERRVAERQVIAETAPEEPDAFHP